MGLADNIFSLIPKRALTLQDPGQWFDLGFGRLTSSGKAIGPDTAKRVSAVYSCVSILADTVGWLPLETYKSRKGGGKDKADSLEIYSILHDRPNDEQTPIEFKKMIVEHLAYRGNFYAYKELDNAGNLKQLLPIHPDTMRLYRNPSKNIIYEYSREQGQVEKYTRDQIFHLRLPVGYDGLKGESIICFMAESIGMSLASEEFGARFFAHDATPSGGLETDRKLSDAAYNRLKADMDNRRGSSQSHRFMIFEEGMKWKQLGITARDAQLLELRNFTVRDIARFFRIPPHMIGDTEKQTSWGSGIEQQGIGFVQYTLMPWLALIEQGAERDLLGDTLRKRHSVKFTVTALLRGDQKARFDSYAIARQWGWLSTNEIRELEEQNPIENGDDYIVPMNMTPTDKLGEAPAAAPAPADNQQQNSLSRFQPLLLDACARVLRKECFQVRNAIKKYVHVGKIADFRAWMDTFYSDFEQSIVEIEKPLFSGLFEGESERFLEDQLRMSVFDHVFCSKTILLTALNSSKASELAVVLEERIALWETKRQVQACDLLMARLEVGLELENRRKSHAA